MEFDWRFYVTNDFGELRIVNVYQKTITDALEYYREYEEADYPYILNIINLEYTGE